MNLNHQFSRLRNFALVTIGSLSLISTNLSLRFHKDVTDKSLLIIAGATSAAMAGSVFLDSASIFLLGILLPALILKPSAQLGLILILNGVLHFSVFQFTYWSFVPVREALLVAGFAMLLPSALKGFRSVPALVGRSLIFSSPWVILLVGELLSPAFSSDDSFSNVLEPLSHIGFVLALLAIPMARIGGPLITAGTFSVALATPLISLLTETGPNLYQDFPDLRAGGTLGHPNLAASIAAIFLLSNLRGLDVGGSRFSPGEFLFRIFLIVSPTSAILSSGTRSVGFIMLAVLGFIAFRSFKELSRVKLAGQALLFYSVSIGLSIAIASITSLIPRLFSAVTGYVTQGVAPASLTWRTRRWAELLSETSELDLTNQGASSSSDAHSLYLNLYLDYGAWIALLFVLSVIGAALSFVRRGLYDLGFFWIFGMLIGITDSVFLWSGFTLSLLILTLPASLPTRSTETN